MEGLIWATETAVPLRAVQALRTFLHCNLYTYLPYFSVAKSNETGACCSCRGPASLQRGEREPLKFTRSVNSSLCFVNCVFSSAKQLLTLFQVLLRPTFEDHGPSILDCELPRRPGFREKSQWCPRLHFSRDTTNHQLQKQSTRSAEWLVRCTFCMGQTTLIYQIYENSEIKKLIKQLKRIGLYVLDETW